MEQQFCPGAKILRQPQPEFTSCPNCGEEVEIWSDERKRPCPRCGETVVKERGEEQVSCLDWCLMGKECVGEKAYNRYIRSKSENLKTRLLKTFKEWNGEEEYQRLRETILPAAENLAKRRNGDLHIILPSIVFRRMKSNWIEAYNNSKNNENNPEKEFERFVRKNLLRGGLQQDAIDEISALLFLSAEKARSAEPNTAILLAVEST